MKTKLIRDKIPEIVESKWEKILTYIANNNEYILKLLEKVVEESKEICNSKNNDELKEEIADLYEVLDSILKNKNINKSDIIEIQKMKRKNRWWFDKKIILKY